MKMVKDSTLYLISQMFLGAWSVVTPGVEALFLGFFALLMYVMFILSLLEERKENAKQR